MAKRTLVDVGLARAESTNRTSETAMNHFKRFLDYQEYHTRDYKEIPVNEVTQQMFGYFADYLVHVAKLGKSGSALDYLSSVRVKFQNLHKAIALEINDVAWYKKFRSNTEKMYMELEF